MPASVRSTHEAPVEGVPAGEAVDAGEGVVAGEGVAVGEEEPGTEEAAVSGDVAGAAAGRLGAPLHPVAPARQSEVTTRTARSRERLAGGMRRRYGPPRQRPA